MSKQERESYDPADLDQFRWGKQSRDRLAQLIEQGRDRVALTIVDEDRYDRRVAEVRLADGTLVQEVLARSWVSGRIQALHQQLP